MRLKFRGEERFGRQCPESTRAEESFDGKSPEKYKFLSLFRGERVGIIRKNGIGKSTLLKIIDKMRADKGEIEIWLKSESGIL